MPTILRLDTTYIFTQLYSSNDSMSMRIGRFHHRLLRRQCTRWNVMAVAAAIAVQIFVL